MKTTRFTYRKEHKQNPYIGFTSFNHFRNDPLYSDIVVGGERPGLETEAVESYPVPQGVPQNGREQGYHPDTTVAYIRINWKNFEPEEGKFDYAFIQGILDEAKKNGQTVMFRLMPHTTTEDEDVPAWLRNYIECPVRPKGTKVGTSPSDPKFLDYYGAAVKALAERFDDDPIFDTFDISLPGAWGEGNGVKFFEKEQLQAFMDLHTRVFKHTRLIGQVCAPWLVNYACQTSPVGWRGDGTGNPGHINVLFPNAHAQMSEVWKKAPVSFESWWWISEWLRRGWDIDEIIRRTLSWHLSTFNTKFIPVQWELKDKIDAWVAKMGYHYGLTEFSCSESVRAGEKLSLALKVNNYGVAPLYNENEVKIRLTNGKNTYDLTTGLDAREWLEGEYAEKATLELSETLEKGEYTVAFGISTAAGNLALCMDAEEKDGFYAVGSLRVE